MSNTDIFQTDKFYWHGFISFYENFFKEKKFQNIAEIGVYRGDSIRWLLDRFPLANVYGDDILPPQDSWPKDSRFHFLQIDQGDPERVKLFFEQNSFDLIIDDGSHIPRHQIISLLTGIKSLNKDGIYILEDIHTSHPHHTMCIESQKQDRAEKKIGNALSALLAIDHYRRIGVDITRKSAGDISENSLLSLDEILFLDREIKQIHLYRRTFLPNKCFNCGGVDYDFSRYKCKCGVDLFLNPDSMLYVLIKS